MSEQVMKQTNLWQEASGLVSVGLSVWVAASVAAFAGLSNSGFATDLHSDEIRAATLVVGFALGALALLGWGTFGLLNGSRRVAAVIVAAGAFLVPLMLGLARHALGEGRATLAPGLLVLLLLHVTVLVLVAPRERRRLGRTWLPAAVLLLLGLVLVLGELVPQAAAGALP